MYHSAIVSVLVIILYTLIYTTHSTTSNYMTAFYESATDDCKQDFKLEGAPLSSSRVYSFIICASHCSKNELCKGINVRVHENGIICDLMAGSEQSCNELKYEKGVRFRRKVWISSEYDGTDKKLVHSICPHDRCETSYRKIYQFKAGATEPEFGRFEELAEALSSLTSGIRIVVENTTNKTVYQSEDVIIVYRYKRAVFQTPGETIDGQRIQVFISTLAQVNRFNHQSRTIINIAIVRMSVYIQAACDGQTNVEPIYKKSLITNDQNKIVWREAQRQGSMFVVRSYFNKMGYTSIQMTSSTIFNPELNEFAATTKTYTYMSTRYQNQHVLYRGNPPAWITHLFTSDATAETKTFNLRDEYGELPHDAPVRWFVDNCRKKIYEIDNTGEESSLHNFDYLVDEIYKNRSGRIFIRVEGNQQPPYDVITFQPDIVICNVIKSKCSAISDRNPEISKGILTHNKIRLNITSIDNQYIYRVSGPKMDYFEIGDQTAAKIEAPFRHISWYKSEKPYNLVFSSNDHLQTQVSDLIQAANFGRDLILVIGDSVKNETIVIPVIKTYIFASSTSVLLITNDVLIPESSFFGCTNEYNRVIYNVSISPSMRPIVYLLVWNSPMTEKCHQENMVAKVVVFASM